jgi:circadian clock protein KaiB
MIQHSDRPRSNNTDGTDRSRERPRGQPLKLRLYIARGAAHSVAAETSVRALLGEFVKDLEIVDVLAERDRALQDNILVTPALVRLSPSPVATLIGDLADESQLKLFLGL